MGVVEHIHIADVKGAPMRSIDTVSALRGIGLAGDRYAIGAGFWHDSKVARDRTLIESEAIEEFERVDRVVLRPGEARRNLTTRGVELNALVGRAFWVGNALCRGTHLCKPCRHLEEVTGKRLLRSLVHRGGLRAQLLSSAPIRVGDSLKTAEEQEGVGVLVERRSKLLLGLRLVCARPRHLVASGREAAPGGNPASVRAPRTARGNGSCRRESAPGRDDC